jgi:hypothetical protein
MGKRPTVGSVILIKHDGTPTVWPVQKTGDDDMAHLLEIFETARKMCHCELLEGGTLKLMDVDNNLLKELRGVQ